MRIVADEGKEAPPLSPPPKPKRFRELSFQEKLLFIWDYYKVRIALALALLLFATTSLPGLLHPVRPILYAGAVNVAIEEELAGRLSEGYLQRTGREEETLQLNRGLYLTDNTQSEAFTYSYASRVKILAAIDDQTLDIVLLDQEAFDAFAQSGFLYDLSTVPALSALPLVENIELIEITPEENGPQEANQDEEGKSQEEKSVEEETKTQAATEGPSEAEPENLYRPLSYPMALALDSSPFFASFSDTVYAAIIRNTPRLEEAISYLGYLAEG